MDFCYKINPELNIPIYKQLLDGIALSVKKGELKDGQKLPTVNELSDTLGVARGTVKKAYDELEKLGLLEKVQGRGTFISYRPDDSLSRKERAMSAIDEMLDKLEALNFSATETNIFLNLKLKERAEKTDTVNVAFFECNPENLSRVSEQMREIPNVELYSYLLDTVRQNPYSIDRSFDLVVTTQLHYDEVKELFPRDAKIVRAALRLTQESLSNIIKLRAGQTVGIACYSERFGMLLKNNCETYTEDVSVENPFVFQSESSIDSYLKGKDVLLLPEHFERYCSQETAKAIHKYKGQIITCSYELDDGSTLYLREKTRRILESKSL